MPIWFFEESGWDRNLEDGGIGCQTTNVSHPIRGTINIPITEDRDCLNFIYGFILTKGVPAAGGYPALPVTIISEYIHTDDEIDIEKPWLTTSGKMPKYTKMSMRFGLSNPEQFALIEPALKQLQRDMLPFQNLSLNPIHERSSIERGFDDEEYPITWAIQTGDPVIRFVAANSMQDEMQETLLLGLVFCMFTIWWGFRNNLSLKNSFDIIKKDWIIFFCKISFFGIPSRIYCLYLSWNKGSFFDRDIDNYFIHYLGFCSLCDSNNDNCTNFFSNYLALCND